MILWAENSISVLQIGGLTGCWPRTPLTVTRLSLFLLLLFLTEVSLLSFFIFIFKRGSWEVT